MSRAPDDHRPDDPTGPEDGQEPPRREGRLRTTTPGSVAGFAVVGLVLGWLTRPVSVRLIGYAPTVGWWPVLVLLFVAVLVGWTAWATWALRRRRERLDPHHAVNRLVLAKACVLAGALFAGGYIGYAISWVGLTDAVLARQRIGHSLAAGAAGVLLVVGSLLLERACRVRTDEQ